jgi:hypothetical protein
LIIREKKKVFFFIYMNSSTEKKISFDIKKKV